MGRKFDVISCLITTLVLLSSCVKCVKCDDGNCYGAGSIALSVVLSVIITLIIVGAFYRWIKNRIKTEHLILETDPEKGKGEYAFDNPGFKDASLTTTSAFSKPSEKLNESEKSLKQKWTSHWSAITTSTKPDRKKALDDSSLRNDEIKIVSLRSHDFAGLGFSICGNMKEGIFIKDVLNRGPASESGKLNAGDRINSVTINFEHMVLEDAQNILSYASPYEVIIEAKNGRVNIGSSSKNEYPIIHPIYRSSSSTDLQEIGKKSFSEQHSNNSTLQKTLNQITTTLERKNSKTRSSTSNSNKLNSEQLKNQLEKKITPVETEARLIHKTAETTPINVRIEAETHQKSENKLNHNNNHQKFGVKVFPTPEDSQQKSPKTFELLQNDNNINIEIIKQIDEVDFNKPLENEPVEIFKRNGSLNGSGLKRDSNGIPQELPSHMLNAAVAARRNRKSFDENPNLTTTTDDENSKTANLRKSKGKAPPPPSSEEKLPETKQNYINDSYNSDSDIENDLNKSSVNTIELNSSDITIHNEENRKTASTGDLTKMQKGNNKNSGTLERAQSLDITDAPNGAPIRRIEDSFEDLFGKAMNREPRLSLILDGLNTFQRNRLKKSTEWGNLEDAILRSGDDNSINSNNSDVEFDAVVNKIKEIRKESSKNQPNETQGSKNQIWPNETGKVIEIEVPSVTKITPAPVPKTAQPIPKVRTVQNEIWPNELVQNEETISVEENNTKPNITKIHKRQQIPSEEISPPPNMSETLESNEMFEECEIEDNSQASNLPIRNSETGEFYDSNNTTDESKTSILNNNELFIYNERFQNDTNISDDLKVSRHTLGSLEIPKSDDVKESLKCTNNNISNVLISTENGSSSLHSLEFSVNTDEIPTLNDETIHLSDEDDDELYKTAINQTMKNPEKDSSNNSSSKITITTPDLIKNVTITEAINTLNNDFDNESNSASSLTFITEIHVSQPEIDKVNSNNVSEIEIISNETKNLDNEFETYIKNFEENKNGLMLKNENDEKYDESSKLDVEKELTKIHEIAEEQLKKLPEMRFTTSYETPVKTEKRQSQIEVLRSNFEKTPSKIKNDTNKSRIPISTSSTKTPPMSPERRDSKNLDINNENEMFELITSSTSSLVHSTPKIQKSPPNKNVTITSIRNNSKLPSGLPVLSGKTRKNDENDSIILGNNTNNINSFKQWVANNTVTSISLPGQKQKD